MIILPSQRKPRFLDLTLGDAIGLAISLGQAPSEGEWLIQKLVCRVDASTVVLDNTYWYMSIDDHGLLRGNYHTGIATAPTEDRWFDVNTECPVETAQGTDFARGSLGMMYLRPGWQLSIATIGGDGNQALRNIWMMLARV